MQAQAEVSRRTVKTNEEITWEIGADWLTQFKRNLEVYLSKSRYKLPTHVAYAKELKAATQNGNQEAIANLLLLLSNYDKRLKPKGRYNRKPSFLYEFCKVALDQYGICMQLDRAREHLRIISEKNLNKTEEEYRERIANLTAHNDKNDALIVEFTKEIENNKKQIHEHDVLKQELLERLEKSQTAVHALENELRLAQEKITQSHEKNQQQQTTIHDLNLKIKSLSGALKTSEQTLITDKKKHQEEIIHTQENLTKETLKRADLEKDLEKAPQKYKDLKAKFDNLKQYQDMLEKDYKIVTTWITNVFGVFLHIDTILSFILRESLTLLPKQITMMREILLATPDEFTKKQKEVDTCVEEIKSGDYKQHSQAERIVTKGLDLSKEGIEKGKETLKKSASFFKDVKNNFQEKIKSVKSTENLSQTKTPDPSNT